MAGQETRKPEWTPPGAGSEFASFVMKGVDHTPRPEGRRFLRPNHDANYYVDGILAGSRTILAKAITLVESNNPDHSRIAHSVIADLLPRAGNSLRVGITGVPGAGKSTFIDAFGTSLCEQGKQVAVLAVDPSSTVSGGSILGDKTRMERLAFHPNAFIRPSPSAGNLGGVTRKSRETIVLCEAFGFNVVLVETVGVGQSETTVRSMVDFFLLLMIGGAGDELQGIKKGVIEIADALLVNKADGPNETAAKFARQEYSRALHYLSAATPGWKTDAFTCSAITGEGIPEFWSLLQKFESAMKASGVFQSRRKQQRIDWMLAMAEQYLRDTFYHNPAVKTRLHDVVASVAEGALSTSAGARDLLRAYYEHLDLEKLRDEL